MSESSRKCGACGGRGWVTRWVDGELDCVPHSDQCVECDGAGVIRESLPGNLERRADGSITGFYEMRLPLRSRFFRSSGEVG